MFNEPIKSIEKAKEFYRSMGCSRFHMARECLQRYNEYKLLKISGKQENEWKTEQLNDYYNMIMKNETKIDLWIIHSKMSDLAEDLRNEKALQLMLEVTEYISEKVPLGDRIIVSETINGRGDRKCRSGLIYLANDLGNYAIAISFIKLSIHFATYIEQKSRNYEKCQKSIDLCHAIKIELNL